MNQTPKYRSMFGTGKAPLVMQRKTTPFITKMAFSFCCYILKKKQVRIVSLGEFTCLLHRNRSIARDTGLALLPHLHQWEEQTTKTMKKKNGGQNAVTLDWLN